ncbi:TSUP family transporter [Cedecea davisae]|uniref:TSUP family transporter n=1 Tax=Cedecea davisae TaxID=158484 RepID=UPI00242F0EEB|nr:TSUP family transporter [Cedecea davisae]
MNELTLTLAIAATFVLAGTVKGVTGMGLPTVAMGILGSLISPVATAGMLLLPSFLTNLFQLYEGGNLPALLKRLWPMMLTIVLGTQASSSLLASGSSHATTIALGTSVMAVLAALIGLFAGQRIRKRISTVAFKRGILVCLILLGADMVLRALL